MRSGGTEAATAGSGPDPAPPPLPTLTCADCGTAFVVGANFCPHCGQETHIRLPRVFDFLREAADETIGFSGRLPRTLALLLFRPGRLTTEYVAGHRQRYVRPMRLYLSVSLVFFALLGLATSDLGWIHVPSFGEEHGAAEVDGVKTSKPSDEKKAAASEAAGKTDDSKAEPVNKVETKTDLPEVDLTRLGASRPWNPAAKPATTTSSIDSDVGKQIQSEISQDLARDTSKVSKDKNHDEQLTDIPWLNERLKRYQSMSQDQFVRTLSQGAQANAPYAVFILMPLAAFWYQLFYIFRGRRYAEHLLHAVHLHCFAFCIGAIALLPWVAGFRTWLILLIGVYALLAERRVYRSGWIRAGLGTLLGSFLYLIGIFIVGTLMAILALAF